ncbi:monocarboxylate transporter 13-like [Branchiostoma floridae]|uniref:Monocarboxylate transporter 13-like n=1 Tax=Branchiostoma floridae TaxID=7739 RepID=A0A9J7MQH4_BRAFL|nr:monocarboxylate transporter 13-like [Branchiostoma floridae]
MPKVRLDVKQDGGWGWVVVAGAFFIHAGMQGLTYAFGVFFAEFREVFQESAGVTSFISSILLGTSLICSPIAGALSNLTSCRTAIIAGGVISAAGLVVSYFAQTMIHLFFSVGIVTGFGISLMYAPSLAMVGRYFDRRHGTANGIVVCGTGVGQFALPPLFQFLIDEFGWRGALLIVAGLMLNGCVCGALMRPIHLAEDGTNEQVDREAQSSGNTELPFHQRACETFHFSLLKHRPFLVYSVSMFGMVLGISVVFVHLVAHAQNLGVEKTSSVFLLSIMGVTEIISRPLNGWLSDRGKISKVYYYMIGVTGMAVANLAIPFASNYAGLVVCMVLYGIFSGVAAPLIAVLVCRYSGASRISSGLGWAFVFQGAAFLLGAPVAGWLYDATGNYDMSFFAAAIFMFVSVLVLLLNPCSTTSRTLGPGTGGLPDRPDGIEVLSNVKRDVNSEDGIVVLSHVKRDVSSEEGIVVLSHVKRDVSSEDGQSNLGFRR